MPLYEYHCTKCGYRFEKIAKFNSEPEMACSRCGGPLERPLTAPALQFKGAGWYVNDYAPKSTSKSAEKPADSGAAATADAKPSTAPNPASESKPAATESSPKPASTPSTSSTTS